MDKIARIDMGAAGGPKVTVGDLGEYAGLGGRAMTSLVIAAEVHPLCHALGAENKLVIAPGMLSGTTGSMTGRLSVGCKSPLTGTIKESNAGGQAAQVLARLGYAAVILEGKPEGDDLYKIYINKDGIKVIVDNSLKLMDNYPLVAKLREEYGDKVAYMSIGSAGERKLLAASIACTDPELRPTRHCGRGGVGAVMGAKRVKAIILDDAGIKMRPPEGSGKVPRRQPQVRRRAAQAPGHRRRAAGLRHQRADQRPQRGGRLPDQQLQDRAVRRLLQPQRRDPGRTGDQARRVGHPRLPSRLRHPVLRDLQRQGRQLRDQAARVRDGLVPRRPLRHLESGHRGQAGLHRRQHRRGHHRNGRHHRGGHGCRTHRVR